MLPLADSMPESVTDSMPESVNQTLVDEAQQTAASADDAATEGDEEAMASSAERMTILRMVEQGKISAEDGARLLAALGSGQEETKPRPRFDTSRHLQVRVSDLITNRQKVNVTVPIGLIEVAWRWLPAAAQEQLAAMQAAIDADTRGRLVEVVDQESGVRVEITLL